MARRKLRLSRVDHGLRRIVILGRDGYLTLDAVRWIAEQDISLTVIERDGSVHLATGRQGTSDARLRRVQACLPSKTADRIARELIDQKLLGQARNFRELLKREEEANVIERYRRLLPGAFSSARIQQIESMAASLYWSTWQHIPLNWQKRDLPKIPTRWLEWGPRKSALAGESPRAAISPAHAMLNYLYAILESEATIALQTLGLDPTFGIMHADYRLRNSLSLDIMEVVRPVVDRWLFKFMAQPMERRWFVEMPTGQCRLMACLCERLAETAVLWAKALAPVAESLMLEMWKATRGKVPKPPTRLTQRSRRAAFLERVNG